MNSLPTASAFSLPPGIHYLNCAYLGPLPKVVEQAGLAGVARKANPAAITAADFFTESDAVRRLFAQLVNGETSRVALVPAVSYGVATVVRNTPIARGQNLVFVGGDFPSDVYAWRKAAVNAGAEIRVVSPPEALPRGERWNAGILSAIDRHTAVVAVPPVHWADGTLFDLDVIGQQARDVGAAFVVDGTQSVGALPLDVRRIQPDALFCAGYKWLLGPYSTAFAYFGPRYDRGEPLEETWFGRKGSDDFQRLVDYEDEYASGAIRYDGGQRSNFILLPMMKAALRFVLDAGPDRIQDHCAALVASPLAQLSALGFELEDTRWRAGHLFGLRMPASVDAAALQAALNARAVFVSMRGSAIRVSPHVYNDERDSEALIDALQEMVRG